MRHVTGHLRNALSSTLACAGEDCAATPMGLALGNEAVALLALPHDTVARIDHAAPAPSETSVEQRGKIGGIEPEVIVAAQSEGRAVYIFRYDGTSELLVSARMALKVA